MSGAPESSTGSSSGLKRPTDGNHSLVSHCIDCNTFDKKYNFVNETKPVMTNMGHPKLMQFIPFFKSSNQIILQTCVKSTIRNFTSVHVPQMRRERKK